MAQTSLVPVQFNGATLVTTLIDGVPYVALRPICESIGVDWKAQYSRIKRHPVLSTCVVVTTTQMPGDDQAREVFMLPLDKLNGWLFGVSVSRVKPELRGRLTVYQAECFDTLARHFGAQPLSKPQQLPNALRQIAPQHTTSQVASAMGIAWAMAGLVQQEIAHAILAGGDEWKKKRYLLSFITDSKLSAPPMLQELSADTHLLSQDKLTNLMAEAAVNAWHTVLGDIRTPQTQVSTS